MLTREDLYRNINLLRRRVEVPDLMLAQATDPTMSAKYANVESAPRNMLLEVYCESRIELAFEGIRFDDLIK